LTEYGLFVVPGFLPAARCVSLREELAHAPRSPTEVYQGGALCVDETQRRTRRAKASAPTEANVGRRLGGLASALSEHFGVPLAGCEPPQFLVYRQGDRFRPHQDAPPGVPAPVGVAGRQVSVVLFLNGRRGPDGAGEYEGGELVFYNLAPRPNWQTARTPLAGRAGLLVAFPSGVFHEVAPVNRGVRYTVVTWFLSPRPEEGPRHGQENDLLRAQ
jgi:predicted 2-oxoglutarate/Fe(II)-dependent dioxygenase YbiX